MAGSRACVSALPRCPTKHANFIQADEGGSADDVFALMHDVRRRVAAETGVLLEPETRLVGFGALAERVTDEDRDTGSVVPKRRSGRRG